MILVDAAKGSRELQPLIKGMGVPCEIASLQYADAAMEGNGREGTIAIGVERKALHDMLSCIEDHRYTGHQLPGMKHMYNVSILLVEGYWKPREDGMLMESRNGCDWWVCRPAGKPVMYSKLRRYLISVNHSGVIVNFTQNMWHTAYDICEIYHYHQKRWNDHTSLREIHKLAIPQLNGKPSLVRKWASDIEGVGVKFSEEAERYFRKPIRLANSDEGDWLRIGRIGPKTAQDIVRQIGGTSR